MDKALDKTGLNIIQYPAKTTEERNQDGDYTAKGTYINFLQFENYILLPQFGLDTDDLAFIRTKELFPNYQVIPVNSNEIATNGGVLNCITWNIKSKHSLMRSTLKIPHIIKNKHHERVDNYY